jgi:hypothetical protein
MIDNFSILLSHGLLMIAFWIMIQRSDVNDEAPPLPDGEPEGFASNRKTKAKIERPAARNPTRRPSASRKAREQKNRTEESGDA